MPTSKTERLLYSILKQSDQKTVDWEVVSRENNIPNTPAARKRYSRFKTMLEEELAAGIGPAAQPGSGKCTCGSEKKNVKRFSNDMNGDDLEGSSLNTSPKKRQRRRKLKGPPVSGNDSAEAGSAEQALNEEKSG
ncbi:hypothetical protein BDZ91DRAFT_757796 [Kalaharituber pfeilii]|nr:hypothetical protein BDZ91DRAFT_757796 [Kalaharituber pfeilii]